MIKKDIFTFVNIKPLRGCARHELGLKSMKHYLLATLLLLTSFGFYSCDSSKEELKAKIEAANKECPIDLGLVGSISSYQFDEDADEVIITMTISKELPIKINVLNKLKNTLKRAMLGNWANSPSGRQLMKEIVKADSKLTFIMQLEEGNENLKIRLTKDEIKDLAERKIDPVSPREILEINVTSTNAQCPMQVDEYTTLSSAALEGNYFVFNYSIDENMVPIESIEQNEAAVKATLQEAIASPDPMMKQMIKVCKNANTGLKYRYVGDISGSACVITLEPSEL